MYDHVSVGMQLLQSKPAAFQQHVIVTCGIQYRWPAGYMQWREYELRRLHQEGINVSQEASPPPLTTPPQDPSDEQQHFCHAPQGEADETEQDKVHKVSTIVEVDHHRLVAGTAVQSCS